MSSAADVGPVPLQALQAPRSVPAARSLPVPAPPLPVRPCRRRQRCGPARWAARWAGRAPGGSGSECRAGGAGGARPRYLAAQPASLSPPGQPAPT